MASSSSAPKNSREVEDDFYGGVSGWVEARTTCDHLSALADDLVHIPNPDSHCTRCQHPAENWVCLSCKDVLCSRFINKHMFIHYENSGHCLALSYRSRMNFYSSPSSSSTSPLIFSGNNSV